MSLFILLLTITLTACVVHAPETGLRSSRTLNKYTSTHTPRSSSTGEYYTVKKGDSLWKISKRFGTSVERIMRSNRITSASNLKTGQKLSIPYEYKKTANSPFIWPVKGTVISSFNEVVNGVGNKGLDIKTTSRATVKASNNGKVVFCDHLKGWGQTIILQHANSYYTIYANLTGILENEGSSIKKGTVIARVAPSKKNNIGILHFEIRKKYLPQNPLRYLN
ncbi:MAG: LysM peptidoglycan-binding domain-containing M23 family metallopeptidase [Candidatus Omnitrophica bacterium]|nr:LysM peptidoglycan-binding domain-containing M23 family metallopeptidase [Candidatus Omnitrophota bacterium]